MRALIPIISKIRKAERADAAKPQKFSSNFHIDAQRATRKMGVRPPRITRPIPPGPSTTCVGNIPVAVRTYAGGQSANSNERCSASTVSNNAHAALRRLHSKVTNAVLYLANTGAAFVVFESRLIAALCGSGEVEASLAGKAPRSWFGTLSVVAAFSATPPVGPAFEPRAFSRRTRVSSSYRNCRSGMISPRRCRVGAEMDVCRKV